MEMQEDHEDVQYTDETDTMVAIIDDVEDGDPLEDDALVEAEDHDSRASGEQEVAEQSAEADEPTEGPTGEEKAKAEQRSQKTGIQQLQERLSEVTAKRRSAEDRLSDERAIWRQQRHEQEKAMAAMQAKLETLERVGVRRLKDTQRQGDDIDGWYADQTREQEQEPDYIRRLNARLDAQEKAIKEQEQLVRQQAESKKWDEAIEAAASEHSISNPKLINAMVHAHGGRVSVDEAALMVKEMILTEAISALPGDQEEGDATDGKKPPKPLRRPQSAGNRSEKAKPKKSEFRVSTRNQPSPEMMALITEEWDRST